IIYTTQVSRLNSFRPSFSEVTAEGLVSFLSAAALPHRMFTPQSWRLTLPGREEVESIGARLPCCVQAQALISHMRADRVSSHVQPKLSGPSIVLMRSRLRRDLPAHAHSDPAVGGFNQ